MQGAAKNWWDLVLRESISPCTVHVYIRHKTMHNVIPTGIHAVLLAVSHSLRRVSWQGICSACSQGKQWKWPALACSSSSTAVWLH